MSKILDLMFGLTGNSGTKDVTAQNTPAAGSNTKQLATTEFVKTATDPKAPLASPTFTGTPAAPTPALDDNTTKLATTEFLRNQFIGTGKRSISGNGYQKLPGGLIIQWGTTSNITGGSFGNVVLPTPMSTAILQVVVTTQAFVNSTTPIVGGWQLDAGNSLAQFTLRNISASTAQFSWLAIGY